MKIPLNSAPSYSFEINRILKLDKFQSFRCLKMMSDAINVYQFWMCPHFAYIKFNDVTFPKCMLLGRDLRSCHIVYINKKVGTKAFRAFMKSGNRGAY